MASDFEELGNLYKPTSTYPKNKKVITENVLPAFDYFDCLDNFGNSKSSIVQESVNPYKTSDYSEVLEKFTVPPKPKIEEIPVSRKDIDRLGKVIEETNRRVVMGGGGGSVAVQYANGGVMNGNLFINGTLSASNIISVNGGGSSSSSSFSGGNITGNASFQKGVSYPVRRVTNSGIVTINDYVIYMDSTTGSFDLNLPPLSAFPGHMSIFKKLNSGGNQINIIPPNGTTIEFLSSLPMTKDGEAMTIQNTGIDYMVLASYNKSI